MADLKKELPQTDGAPAPAYKGRWLLGCSLTAAVAVLGVAVAVWSWMRNGERACAQYSQELRLAAEAQLAERPRIPEEANAAPLYTQAFRLFVVPSDQNFYDKLTDPARDFKDAATVKHLADNAAYLAAVRAALGRPGCDFQVDWTRGIDAQLPHIQNLRQAAKFLCVAARHEAQTGRPAEALDLLAMMLHISRDAGEDCLISRMVRCACENMFATTLQAVLNEADPDQAAIEKLMAVLQKASRERPRMAAALRAENAWMAFTISEVLSGKRGMGSLGQGPGESDMPLGEKVWRLSGRAVKGARLYQRYMDDCAGAAEKPYPEGLDAMAEIDRQMDQASAAAPRDYVLARLLQAATSRMAESDATAEARLRIALLALGCKLHRQKTGTWPGALTDLTAAMPEHFKELPTDPFSGKALVYKKTPGGCLIYSIGRNRKDDGGIPWDSKTSVGDVPFELNR
jgi:hypothetical protein